MTLRTVGAIVGLRLLSEVVPAVAGQVFSRKYIMLGRLVTRWDDIVGADLAAKAQPVKLRPYKKDGNKTLFSLDIATTTADATLLHYRKDLILQRINQIFGGGWISALRFVPQAANAPLRKPRRALAPLTARQKTYLSDLLESVPDSEMQTHLENLGKAILQDKR